MKTVRTLIVILLAGAILAGYTNPAVAAGNPAPENGTAPARINGAEARKLVAAGALLIDVRSPEEFADGHIDGARNIPLNVLDAAIPSLPKDKTIVVYCHSGARSSVAATHLADAGYTVRNLGAMSAW